MGTTKNTRAQLLKDLRKVRAELRKALQHKPETRQCNHCAKDFDASTLSGAEHLASCRMYNRGIRASQQVLARNSDG